MNSMVSCILLSAGLSTRFGSPKALARISQRTIIEETQARLAASPVSEIIIVLGAHAEHIEPFILKHNKIKVVYNKDYYLGQTSSFKAGVKGSSALARGFLLLPVDFPVIQPGTFQILVETFQSHPAEIIIPVYLGRRGHPPIFPAALKEALLSVPDQQGLNSFFTQGSFSLFEAEVQDPGVVISFNTPEELERIKKDYEPRRKE